MVASSKLKEKASNGKLIITHINKKYDAMLETMNETFLSKLNLKKWRKRSSKDKKQANKKTDTKPRLYVLDFVGDIRASKAKDLSQCIDAVLLAEKNKSDNTHNKVLLRLDSPGGIVNAYGLAAAELARLDAADICLEVAIDKMAASGGYMMASVAKKIIAAPFAIIGSIGVVMQLPNFHRFLQKHNVDFEQLTAGEYKRTLTMLGKNTDKDRAKAQADVDEIQVLFKNHITKFRPIVEIDKVATGEHWFASQCIAKNLVDKIQTSSDYLLEHAAEYNIYTLAIKHKQKLSKKLANNMSSAGRSIGNVAWRLLQQKTK